MGDDEPTTARDDETCGRSFRSGSGRYYDCERTAGHTGRHSAFPDPAPVVPGDGQRCEHLTGWPHSAEGIGCLHDHPAAPAAGADPAADGELRTQIVANLCRAWNLWPADAGRMADALLSGPLAALVAERDHLRAEAVAQAVRLVDVESERDEARRHAARAWAEIDRGRRALDGEVDRG